VSPPQYILVYVREGEMDRACSTKRDERKAYRVLMGKPEGKKPLRRLRRRWVDNI
jgi:hypothetical protein